MDTRKLIKRLNELISAGNLSVKNTDVRAYGEFRSGSLAFLDRVFGESHIYFKEFKTIVTENYPGLKNEGIGILEAAKKDLIGGWLASVSTIISGEVFAEFVILAKQVLPENKDVAGVLICAALEDALKRLGIQNGLDVIDNDMAQVINALAGAGILQGPQLSTVRSYTKLRNAAFHAKWSDIDSGTVGSAISFTEEFLKDKFQ